jgi:hypothetical protein
VAKQQQQQQSSPEDVQELLTSVFTGKKGFTPQVFANLCSSGQVTIDTQQVAYISDQLAKQRAKLARVTQQGSTSCNISNNATKQKQKKDTERATTRSIPEGNGCSTGKAQESRAQTVRHES